MATMRSLAVHEATSVAPERLPRDFEHHWRVQSAESSTRMGERLCRDRTAGGKSVDRRGEMRTEREGVLDETRKHRERTQGFGR